MSKTKALLVIVPLLVLIIAFSFGAGYALSARDRGTAEPGLGVVAEAWDAIFANYVEKDRLSPSQLSHAAIRGIVTELNDAHTDYFTAEDYQLSASQLEGKAGGIGAEVTLRDKKLVIVAPVPGSPAARAGIRPGDIILKIDGRATDNMTLPEGILLIRGIEGTPVKLVVQHEGEAEPVEMEITRAQIELPSVRSEMRGDIAYIDIGGFSERTDIELTSALEAISQQPATGIVLDLRSNPGGVLDTVINVASHFIREGVVLTVRDSQGRLTPRPVKTGRIVTDLPMIVLVDAHSASGSEVLAGALQDYSRATIAGTRTFGKGSVNIMYRLKDGSGLTITIARWLTPHGNLIEGKGLTPDREITLKGEDAVRWAIDQLHGVNAVY